MLFVVMRVKSNLLSFRDGMVLRSLSAAPGWWFFGVFPARLHVSLSIQAVQ